MPSDVIEKFCEGPRCNAWIITTDRRTRFCSPVCTRRASYIRTHPLITKMCEAGCGKSITTRDKRKRFCSGTCTSRASRDVSAQFTDRVCAWSECGSAFQTNRRDKIYCSSACGKKAIKAPYDRAVRVLQFYGITVERYQKILDSQGGVCAVCGTDEPGGRWGTWCIDHDHSCCPGKRSCGECVRGILCSGCNTGLGKFKDDPGVLKAAVAYLERGRS